MNEWVMGLPFYSTIENIINDTLGLSGLIDEGYAFFTGLNVVVQLLGLVVVAIILVMGFFELLKKLSKIIVVVGILVGLYLLYDGGALDGIIGNTKGKEVSGKKAFELYDTYGFPIDLTALILRERGYDLDEAGFDKAMLEQKTRSRAASEVSTEDWVILEEGNNETFVGYDQIENEVKITRFRKTDSKKDGVLFQIVLNTTPFYPEGGGQVGDKGVLVAANETIQIIDTKKENNLIVHFSKQFPENVNTIFEAKVNQDLRDLSSRNHSATHLMHQALRSILGTHVEQKGSLVNPNYLRFDFSHFSKMTDEEIAEFEFRSKTIMQLALNQPPLNGEMMIELTQNRLDNFARTKGYDDIQSAISYVGSFDSVFDSSKAVCLIV